MNVVPSVDIGKRDRALEMLGRGAGDELRPQEAAPPKFCAAYSSAALALNSFAFWLDLESDLIVPGGRGFDSLDFERQMPTGLRGTSPHLDVFLDGPEPMAIESKCLEPLTTKKRAFAHSYGDLFSAAAPEWRTEYEREQQAVERRTEEAPSDEYRYLDVGQLLRHYLGVRREAMDRGRTIKLAYVYWEPLEATDQAFRAHREEAQRLEAAVGESDDLVPFTSFSYGELWGTWADVTSELPQLREHVRLLRARYALKLDQTQQVS